MCENDINYTIELARVNPRAPGANALGFDYR